MSKGLRGKLTYANVIATVALFVAMGGGAAYAATSLPKHSVGTPQIKAKAVTASKLATGAVTGRKIANRAVAGGKIAANAITSSKVANGSVTLADLAGADISGAISLPSIAAHTCISNDLSVSGAEVGQFPIMSFMGNVALPSTIVALAVKVDASNSVRAKFCNISATSTTATSNIGVRVITLN
jgi:hypothetical protein